MALISLVETMLLQQERAASQAIWLGMQQPQKLQQMENLSSLMVRKVVIWVEASCVGLGASQTMLSESGPSSA